MYEVDVSETSLTDEDEDILNYDDVDDPDAFVEISLRDKVSRSGNLPPGMAVFFMAGASPRRKGGSMQFFASAIDTLQTLVVALGAGLGVWGRSQSAGGLWLGQSGPMLMCGKVTTKNLKDSCPLFLTQKH